MLGGDIQAISMGIAMLNRERLAGTSDFLLTKPLNTLECILEKLFPGKRWHARTHELHTHYDTVYWVHVVKARASR